MKKIKTTKLRRRFTEWFFHKGYRYDFITGASRCPRRVRPFLFLLSPSVYHMMMGREIAACFFKGLNEGLRKIGQEEHECGIKTGENKEENND